MIRRLYHLEAEWDKAKVGEERAALRQKQFARTLRWLHRIVIDQSGRGLPKSQPGKACTYLLNDWDALSAHQQHAFTRLDNNLVENAIRPSAIGKNRLFIGHPDAGQRSLRAPSRSRPPLRSRATRAA